MERGATSLERKMDDLVQRCRDRRMHITPQRMAIYRALLEAEDHPSPETLFQRVRPQMPSLSLATIYKALDTLVELGLVHEVSPLSESKRYDANLDRHHHLICTECKLVVDLYDERLDRLDLSRRPAGFVPQSVHVQVLGICAACAGGRGQM
jgi:Fur family transcriptional regulator, peroxide stress response regulator